MGGGGVEMWSLWCLKFKWWCHFQCSGNHVSALQSHETTMYVNSRHFKGTIIVRWSLALSQILNVASALYAPDWIKHDVDHIFFSYGARTRRHLLKRKWQSMRLSKVGWKCLYLVKWSGGIKPTSTNRIMSEDCQKYSLLKNVIIYKDNKIRKIYLSVLEVK